jgi:hypothetical protein
MPEERVLLHQIDLVGPPAIEHALSVTTIHLKQRRELGPLLVGSMRSKADVDMGFFPMVGMK